MQCPRRHLLQLPSEVLDTISREWLFLHDFPSLLCCNKTTKSLGWSWPNTLKIDPRQSNFETTLQRAAERHILIRHLVLTRGILAEKIQRELYPWIAPCGLEEITFSVSGFPLLLPGNWLHETKIQKVNVSSLGSTSCEMTAATLSLCTDLCVNQIIVRSHTNAAINKLKSLNSLRWVVAGESMDWPCLDNTQLAASITEFLFDAHRAMLRIETIDWLEPLKQFSQLTSLSLTTQSGGVLTDDALACIDAENPHLTRVSLGGFHLVTGSGFARWKIHKIKKIQLSNLPQLQNVHLDNFWLSQRRSLQEIHLYGFSHLQAKAVYNLDKISNLTEIYIAHVSVDLAVGVLAKASKNCIVTWRPDVAEYKKFEEETKEFKMNLKNLDLQLTIQSVEELNFFVNHVPQDITHLGVSVKLMSPPTPDWVQKVLLLPITSLDLRPCVFSDAELCRLLLALPFLTSVQSNVISDGNMDQTIAALQQRKERFGRLHFMNHNLSVSQIVQLCHANLFELVIHSSRVDDLNDITYKLQRSFGGPLTLSSFIFVTSSVLPHVDVFRWHWKCLFDVQLFVIVP